MCNGWLYTISLICVRKGALLVLFVHLGHTATLHAMGLLPPAGKSGSGKCATVETKPIMMYALMYPRHTANKQAAILA